MGKIIGKYITLAIGTSVIGYSKSCWMEADVEIQEVSNPSSGRARKFIAGRYGWKMGAGGLCDDGLNNVKTQLASLTEGTTVTVTFGKAGTSVTAVEWTGTAIVSHIRMDAGTTDRATYTVDLQGTGELSLD